VLQQLDRSERLSKLITWLSKTISAQRGLPVVVAIAMTVVSLIVHALWIVTGSALIGLCGFGVLHLAILIGFLGVLLADPLGRG
jgi:phosphotransferase system  glucose/maltose/N-acetylglucosamine-specific IIC component